MAAADRDAEAFALYERMMGQPVEADLILHANLESGADGQRLVNEVIASLGGLDGLVNNAAWNARRAAAEVTPVELRKTFAVNFESPLWLTLAALPYLRAAQGAAVNISSVLVKEPQPGNLLYASSKAALEAATEMLAAEYFATGVRFNAIRVGRIPGPAFLRDVAAQSAPEEAQRLVREQVPERIALLRQMLGEAAIGRPEDIAEVVAFLLSTEARFINGQILTANGGYAPSLPKPQQPN